MCGAVLSSISKKSFWFSTSSESTRFVSFLSIVSSRSLVILFAAGALSALSSPSVFIFFMKFSTSFFSSDPIFPWLKSTSAISTAVTTLWRL
ncbi:MAG: hypothetical protein ACD_47C00333G0001 [uncultured bacterium]|nr:MAG: hypothetical protein ACD_47C00333G0001 [uncultured bacterium]